MNRAAIRQDVPFIDHIKEGLIVALWQQRLDTYGITKKLGLKEWQVFNKLLHLREGGR